MGSPSDFEGVKRPEAQHERAEAVRVWLLCSFRVSVGSRTIEGDAWRLKKASALVKLLSLTPSHRLHREQMLETLWPGLSQKAASNNLRQTLHAARKSLDPAVGSRYLASEDDTLVLCPGGSLWVDVEAFEEAAAMARRSRDPAAYRAAIELYAGQLLPDDRYEEWAENRHEELQRLYLALLVELAGLYEERRDYGQAVETLQRASSDDPANEGVQAGVMRLYALSERQGEALAQYERLREALSGHLGTEPGSTTRALRDEIAAGRFVPSQRTAPAPEEPPDTSKHNLPAVRTSFVGREREMVEVRRSLAMTNLLTLTGTGGCGKTRLALEVARDLAGAYPDGVWLAELAGLSEGGLVAQEVASVLGVREQQPGHPILETLIGTLSEKKLLLVLDNCEHLIDAAARLADALLDSCPRLRVLATSRAPLGVRGELSWLVPSLSTPSALQSPTVEELEGYESARLFADRASKRHPGFELTPENAQAVAQVCARLEGIPLAIELAAAWVRMLTAEQISERLRHSLRLLTRGERTADNRHQTLRAALDWSYELLSEPEQGLFGKLSVFAGGFTLEAAESVGAGGGIEEEDVLELLSMLVEKSLVVTEESWERGARYRLLEPIRQYAREKLEKSKEEEQTRYRHAEWYLALAEEADRESSGPGHGRWLERLETEHDNLRAALDWSLEEDDAELSLRLAGALWLFWFTRGYSTEGWGWLEKAISLGGPAAPRAKVLNGAGWVALFRNSFETAKALLEESLVLYRELKDEEGIASSLVYLGFVAMLGLRDDIPAADLLEEALALKPRLKNPRTVANMLILAGLASGFIERDWEEAEALHEEALVLFREVGDVWGTTTYFVNLGLIAVVRGDYARATLRLRELMHLSQEQGYKLAQMYAFFGLACVAASEGRTVRAARLWGISETVREKYGVRLPPSARSALTYEDRLAEACARMGEPAFEEVWADGKAMVQQQAVEYALSEESAPPTGPRPEQPLSSEPAIELTPREQEVAVLTSRGLSNRQIAVELGISERTVATHIRNMLKKLGLHSRTQITAWFTEHRPLP